MKIQYYILAKTSWMAEHIVNAYILSSWSTSISYFGSGTSICRSFLEGNKPETPNTVNRTPAQTEVLSERVIQTRKQYLHIVCHDQQHRWMTWLLLAEFAYNSTTTSTVGNAPSS